MAYLPKSKVNIKETPGGEFVERATRKPYTGKYIETSEGKYYAGNNPLTLGSELVIPEPQRNNFGNSRDFKKHTILNKNIYNNLKKFKQVPSFKTIPTEKDYERGYYTRYFAIRINSNLNYFEIEQEVFTSISTRKTEYDYNLYQVGSILWTLTGDVEKTNNLQLTLVERRFPRISVLFPVLNEFKKVEDRSIENLSTNGGELYYKDGSEYKGLYHIHPEKGPMVGAVHIKDQHDILYYQKFETPTNPTQPTEQITPTTPTTNIPTGGSGY